MLLKKCEKSGSPDPKLNIDLGNFPPCSNSLKQHVLRVNFQVRIWKLADMNFPELPDPSSHGWIVNDEGLEPRWCEGEVLPGELIDLLDDVAEQTSDEEEDYESDSSTCSDIL